MKTKTKSIVQHFTSREEAKKWMRIHNRASMSDGREIVVVVAGPDDGWSVVDLETAIEMGCGYTWEVA